MIKSIWLCPPLAFARVGSSETPCDNFGWGPDDLRPEGSGRTQLAGAPTFAVEPDGTLVQRHGAGASELQLKDNGRFRPICPFFEVHGRWSDNGALREGPITTEVLARNKLALDDLEWSVEVANRKAYRFTKSPGDIVEAALTIAGTDTQRRLLSGWSKRDDARPLVFEHQPIALGTVQVVKPTPKWPQVRLRFTPPAGLAYGPAGLSQQLKEQVQEATKALEEIAGEARKPGSGVPELVPPLIDELAGLNKQWASFGLPAEQCILNPQAEWPQWAWPRKSKPLSLQSVLAFLAGAPDAQAKLAALSSRGDRSPLIRFLLDNNEDAGTLPPGVFAFFVHPASLLRSLGMIDDVSDGFVKLRVKPAGLTACARVVVTPPSVVPDRRTPVSIADGLADRVSRDDVRDPAWVSGANAALADAEVHDLLARAYESAGLQNADAVAHFFRTENGNLAKLLATKSVEEAEALLWNSATLTISADLPITAMAWQHHRRMAVPRVFEDFARRKPQWVESRARLALPADGAVDSGPDRYYDMRMPALMRGFDREPLRLTRRQYELLKAWTARLGERA